MTHRWGMLVAVLAAAALTFGCDGGGGGGGGGKKASRSQGSNTVVGAGKYTICALGGNGNTEIGGVGGDVYVESFGTKGITFGGKGTIDTRFTYPADPAIDLGSDPLVVSASTTVKVYIDVADANTNAIDGEYLLVLGDQRLRLRNAAADYTLVTGLHVKAGKTLTLGLNYDDGDANGQDMAYVTFPNDVKVEGTIKTKDLTTGTVNGMTADSSSALDKGALDLEGNRLLVTSKGRINTAGGNATTADTRGGDGGYVYLYGDEVLVVHGAIDARGGNGKGTGIGGTGASSSGEGDWVILDSSGTIVNTASHNATGGDGYDGGHGGEFGFYADGNIYNTGTLVGNGGKGGAGDGGDAWGVEMESWYGSVFNSGKLQTNGGNTTGGDGGSADEITIFSGYAYWDDEENALGEVRNSGVIEAKGGSSTQGGGGYGAELWAETYGGNFVSNATIDLRGGNGSRTGGNYGGDGGYVDVETYEGYDEVFASDYVLAGDIIIGGSINVDAGTGDYGGDSGGVTLIAASDYNYYDEDSFYTNTYPEAGVYAYGYKLIDTRGGNGADGGNGGIIAVNAIAGYNEDDTGYGPAGPIVVSCDFNSSGGNGTDGVGGKAQLTRMQTDYANDDWDDNSTLTFRGNITSVGGNGTAGGGRAPDGVSQFLGKAGLEMVGDITIRGGNGTGVDAPGGSNDWTTRNRGLQLRATQGPITFTGNMNLRGGNATGSAKAGDGPAASGGGVNFYRGFSGDELITIKGNIDAGGGSSGVGGTGGNGGRVDIASAGTGASITGNITNTGGKAAGDGTGGDGNYVNIDFAYSVTIKGNIDVSGGASGTGGTGGDGGEGISINSDDDDVTITGNLTANGGNGGAQGGGGGAVIVAGDSGGFAGLTFKGNASVNGGNAGTDGNGGGGGYVYVDHFYGSVVITGNLSSNGGSASGTGDGGDAGWVDLDMFGDLTMTGNITNRGGNASGTGEGGWGYVAYIDAFEGSVILNGTVDVSGGKGLNGGAGGNSDGWTGPDDDWSGAYDYFPGIFIRSWYSDVTVTGKLINHGGDAKDTGTGGYAGPVEVYANGGNMLVQGSIDASGGDAETGSGGGTGGDGGYVELGSMLGSGITGDVNIDGGEGLTPGDDGEFVMDGIQYLP